MTYRKTKTAAALAAGMLLLSACSRSEPDPQPVEDNAAVIDTPVTAASPEAMPPMAEMNAVAPVRDNAATADIPPEPEVAPDAQMMEDADATGMTARVARGDEAPEVNGQVAQ